MCYVSFHKTVSRSSESLKKKAWQKSKDLDLRELEIMHESSKHLEFGELEKMDVLFFHRTVFWSSGSVKVCHANLFLFWFTQGVR